MKTSLNALILLFVVANAAPAAAEKPFLASKQVQATGKRTCTAYLAASRESVRGAPVVLSMLGTGEYTMAANWRGDPSAQHALDAGAAWLAFDKPGVHADEKAPRRYRIEEDVYNAYTPADLETCAANALAWASALPQVGKSSPIVIRGHSEGAIVATHLLKRLHEKKEAMAPRVTALLLSGTPAGAMRDIVTRQVKANGIEDRYRKALAEKDDAFLRKLSGLGAETDLALQALPPLTETFAALSAHRPTARIALFHGTEDKATPLEMVQTLVKQNRERIDAARPALELSARFYPAGHGLDASAMQDITLWMLDAIRRPGYLEVAEREAAGPVAVDVTEATLAAVAGRYRIEGDVILEIVREGKRLFAQVTGQSRFPIFFASEDKLFTRVAPIEFELERDEKKTIKALVLVQGDRTRCARID